MLQQKMKMSILIILLLFGIFSWIHYLFKNNYIIECYENALSSDKGDFTTTHTVNLPLTTNFSCSNMCINARCSKTKEQCLSDIDCPGCQPYAGFSKPITHDIIGENDSGKLTVGVTPTYSTLTTDIGTKSKLYRAPRANFGINTWDSSFNEGNKLFNKRYNLDDLNTSVNYPKRFNVTGNFLDNGPLASNADLH
jgi:hypothetical protein